MRTNVLVGLACAAAVLVSVARAATPPALVNYQGVLRDASDKPRAGTFDMVFTFFDAASAGNAILVDSHTAGGANAVAVTNGLFNVALGGGTVTDGTGPGTYTALDAVFRDFAAVWLEIKVGGETLAPRVRVQSAAYALNASNLGGQPPAGFVDTSATGQFKAGHLTVNGGLDANVASGVALNATGTQAGGSFGAGSAFAYVADTSVINTGIRAQGTSAGGWFKNGSTGAECYAAYGGIGVEATGGFRGGEFLDLAGDGAYLADGSAFAGVSAWGVSDGVYGNGGQNGVHGVSNQYGGWFYNPSTGTTAVLAAPSYGLDVVGGTSGSHFSNTALDAETLVARNGYGVYASGLTQGGYFYDSNNSGVASLAKTDLGIEASGLQAGGHFTKPGTTAEAYLAASNGSYENGVYGLSHAPSQTPGYFVDLQYGSVAYPGGFGFKITGNGSVSFVQNDPADASRVIRYSAPEGDETAVYTRGSARLVDGEARVPLGPTFRKVANPELGLTATVTPLGEVVPLAVVAKSTTELVVRGPAGSNVAFDYAVWGLRVGFEDRPVVEPKRQEAFIPSKAAATDLFLAHPDLAAFSARSRFGGMDAVLGIPPRRAADGGAAALESAIHVYDPAVDAAKLAPVAPPVADGPRDRVLPFTAEDAPATRAASLPPASASTVGAARHDTRPDLAPGTVHGANAAAGVPGAVEVPVVEMVEPGDVLANDVLHPGTLRRADMAADPAVVGIVAGAAGATWTGSAPLALPGTIVVCKADATYGAIAASDLLVAAPARGYAMRGGENPRQGSVIAKALEPLDAGTGLIKVLVMSR